MGYDATQMVAHGSVGLLEPVIFGYLVQSDLVVGRPPNGHRTTKSRGTAPVAEVACDERFRYRPHTWVMSPLSLVDALDRRLFRLPVRGIQPKRMGLYRGQPNLVRRPRFSPLQNGMGPR